MAGANSNIQITELDFNNIKNNLKTFLQSQDTLKDYNYDGSALSVLLDVLAYNTQYNAYYLNMVANEMFLDTALIRNSVVSHSKLLGYVPKSTIGPEAVVNLTMYQVTDASLTLPKFTNFLSEAIDGINYNFVTTDATTVSVVNNQAVFANTTIKQGTPASSSYLVDETTNPKFTFGINDTNVDTSTLQVLVQQSSSNSSYDIYTSASDYLTLTGDSMVYFLQEGLNGYYEIYFGDGILGKKLTNGNLVKTSYIVTSGTLASGANSFILMDQISGYSNNSVQSVSSASQGSGRESISSIKFQAPKNYAAQGRAVTKEDYITAIQQNSLGYSFDAVNVWGGQENTPPVYGQVFASVKPAGAYSLTQTQKQRLIDDVIKPISMMTVVPTLVDPDYTYIQITVNLLYDPKKTSLSPGQIKELVKTTVYNLAQSSLNTFNSTFVATDFTNAINNSEQSIVTNEISLQVQKKFYPNLTSPTTYKLYYGTPLKKGMFLSGVNSSPGVQFRDKLNLSTIIDGIYIEEVPSSTGGVDSITVLNHGYGYQYAPTVTIQGDGSGATASAVLNADGTIKRIDVLTSGNNYTSATATITPAPGDTTGTLGAAVVILAGQYGTLRTYYNNTQNVKTIFDPSIGTIDYNNGIVTLNSFGPIEVDDPLGQLTISVNPTTSILSSSYNRIITIDPYDSGAIVVNVTAKTS
jgi:hypothetical protein